MTWFKDLFINEAKSSLDRTCGCSNDSGDNIKKPDWNQNDETAPDYIKNRPFYEEEGARDVSGETYTINADDMPAHNQAIPLALGQVWTSRRHHRQGGWMEYQTFEVRQADDGTCYLGSPTLMDDEGNTVIYLTANEMQAPSGMISQGYIEFEFTCVSGTVPGVVIHHIDSKYIKDMYYEEEPPEKVHAEAVFTEEFMDLPEATYEVGKNYTIEINGIREEYTFVTAYVGAFQKYTVGFNIMDGNQGAYVADGTRPCFMVGRYSTADEPTGQVTCELEFRLPYESPITFPATVKVLTAETIIHQIDPKYIGYDAVIFSKQFITEDGASPPEITLKQGSYDDIKKKLKNNQAPRVLWVDEADAIYGTENFYSKDFLLVNTAIVLDRVNNEEHILVYGASYGAELLPDGTCVFG